MAVPVVTSIQLVLSFAMVDHLNSYVFLIICYFGLIILNNPNDVSAYIHRRAKIKENPTVVDNKTNSFYEIIKGLPENAYFKSKSCEKLQIEMPNFHMTGRRISETKCLENLWRFRFYDQVLLKKVRCKSDVDGIYVSFAAYTGDRVFTGKFPHTGAIGWQAVEGNWIFMCGSTLISDRFMLTAAHCARSPEGETRVVDPVPKIVRLGEASIFDEGERHETSKDVKIKNIIVHDKYRHPYKYFDIALIELDSYIPFSVYNYPSCLWSNDYDDVLGEALITGWGIVESASTGIEPELQVGELDLLQPQACREKLKINQSIFESLRSYHVCAIGKETNTCQGDSGGPLLISLDNPDYSEFSIYHIIGIESSRYGCDSAMMPNVYTRVSSFLDWIENIVWNNEIPEREILSEANFPSIYKYN